MHKISRSPGLRPRPLWGSLQRSPRPLAGFRGRLPGKKRGNGWEKEGQWGGRIVERGERGGGYKKEREGCSMGSGGVTPLGGCLHPSRGDGRPWFRGYGDLNVEHR